MKKIITLLTIIVFSLFVVGCSAVPVVPHAKHIKKNAIVHVLRDSNIIGVFTKPVVTVDGVAMGSIPIASHFTMDLPAKKTKFILSAEMDREFDLHLESNKEYLIHLSLIPGLISPHVVWQIIEDVVTIKKMLRLTKNVNGK